MRVETRVYFAVASDELSPEQMTDRIGLTPSSTTVTATRKSTPPIPVTNTWKLESGLDSGTQLNDHLDALLTIVAPLAGRISDLCKNGEAVAWLEIVRKFGASPEDADLGFVLDSRWLEVLRQTGAFVDVDEYDFIAQ